MNHSLLLQLQQRLVVPIQQQALLLVLMKVKIFHCRHSPQGRLSHLNVQHKIELLNVRFDNVVNDTSRTLEKRVKEMAAWPEEIEHLRFENKHLREHVSILLHRISELTSQQMTPPLSSASSAGSCDAAVTNPYPNHHPVQHITQGPVAQAIPHQYPGHPPQYNYALDEPQVERFYHHDMPIRNSAQQPSSYQQHVLQQQQQQENAWNINDDLDLDFPFDPFFDNGRCATTAIAPGEHQSNYSNQDMHTMDIQQWQYCTSTWPVGGSLLLMSSTNTLWTNHSRREFQYLALYSSYATPSSILDSSLSMIHVYDTIPSPFPLLYDTYFFFLHSWFQ